MASRAGLARSMRRSAMLAPVAYGALQAARAPEPSPRACLPACGAPPRSRLARGAGGAQAGAVRCSGPPPAESSRRPALVLFGDSITQQSFSECGWGAGLYNWFHRAADVVNRGFSGYNTRWARIILPGILEAAPGPIVAVTLFFGANDAESTSQHVPVEEYEDNLRAMIDMVKAAAPGAAIIAITPPPVDHSRWSTRSNEQVAPYAAVVRGLPVTAVVDLWGHIEIADLHDGLHLGPDGNRKVCKLLKQAMRSTPGLNPEDGPDGTPQLPMHYPHWSQLSGKTKEQAAAILSGWKWPQ